MIFIFCCVFSICSAHCLPLHLYDFMHKIILPFEYQTNCFGLPSVHKIFRVFIVHLVNMYQLWECARVFVRVTDRIALEICYSTLTTTICIWCVICSLTVRSFGSFSSEIYRALIWNQLRAAYFAIHSKTICSKIMVNHQIFIWWCFDFCSIHLRTTGLNQQNSLFANRSFHAGRMEQHSNENPF